MTLPRLRTRGFEPAAIDIEQLPPAARATVGALLANAGGPGWEARVRLSGSTGDPCEVVLRSTSDAMAEVEISGAGDPPPRPDGPVAAGITGLDERLLELAHLGVWVIDTDGRTTFTNRRMAELLGWDPDELRAQPAPRDGRRHRPLAGGVALRPAPPRTAASSTTSASAAATAASSGRSSPPPR